MSAAPLPTTARPGVRTFVLDTSVLLSDPGALGRFAEHEVVLPLVVISELEGKRHHPELGWFARQTLRVLDDLRIKHGRLDAPVPIGDSGGMLNVELNHSDLSTLPAGFRVDSNDSRILAVALNLAADGRDVTLVTKDMPLRVKAASVGLPADEYRMHPVADSSPWTGMAELDVSSETVDALYDGDPIDLVEHVDFADVAEMPCHTGLVLHSSKGSALARITPDKQVRSACPPMNTTRRTSSPRAGRGWTRSRCRPTRSTPSSPTARST
ncbi:MAG: PhoH-like ATPase, partial [Pseudonocardiales bacterium]|nr:PhoH-like ATPase [Pseudonocardiales bacterium]